MSDKKQTLQELLDSKPGFRQWVEQTDFSHMLTSKPGESGGKVFANKK